MLNALEKKRIESIGLDEWKGMMDEIIFDEGISWLNRPLLNSLYGVQKLLEGFGQMFLTGYIKGELSRPNTIKCPKRSNWLRR